MNVPNAEVQHREEWLRALTSLMTAAARPSALTLSPAPKHTPLLHFQEMEVEAF